MFILILFLCRYYYYYYYHSATITSTATTMSRDVGKGEVSSLRSGIQGNLSSILDMDKLPSLPHSLQTEFRKKQTRKLSLNNNTNIV
jgi:hypothetical protein